MTAADFSVKSMTADWNEFLRLVVAMSRNSNGRNQRQIAAGHAFRRMAGLGQADRNWLSSILRLLHFAGVPLFHSMLPLPERLGVIGFGRARGLCDQLV